MSLFAAEIGQLIAAVKTAFGGDIYAVPWYLVVGEPRTGKSTVIRSMNLTWQGEGKVNMPGSPMCTYFLSKEAVFIEAGDRLCGPNKNLDFLRALADELKKQRPREPLDGLLLVISCTDVAELSEEPLQAHAQSLRTYLVETCKNIGADIPCYVIANRYDTLWGFAEVFAWNAERAKEEAWGFVLPPETPSQGAMPKIQEGLHGLQARIEALCLTKLSSEEGVEQRIKAFQHLSESRQFLEKLHDLMKVVAFSSRYERAPWMRAVIVGAAVPGVGDRIRACISRFSNMGLIQNPYDQSRSTRPGGLPVFGFMRTTILPEKELVPSKVRWRDDIATVLAFILGFLLLAAATTLFFVWRYS
jgi:type VI protein secretion system component VasK